jgi:hypothetical protein
MWRISWVLRTIECVAQSQAKLQFRDHVYGAGRITFESTSRRESIRSTFIRLQCDLITARQADHSVSAVVLYVVSLFNRAHVGREDTFFAPLWRDEDCSITTVEVRKDVGGLNLWNLRIKEDCYGNAIA